MTFIPFNITTPDQFKMAVTVASIAASILVAVQTFLDWRTNAEQHRTAAIKYNNLKTHIEMILAQKDITEVSIEGVKQELEKLRMISPPISESEG